MHLKITRAPKQLFFLIWAPTECISSGALKPICVSGCYYWFYLCYFHVLTSLTVMVSHLIKEVQVVKLEGQEVKLEGQVVKLEIEALLIC